MDTNETQSWVKVQSARAIYQPESCGKMPIQGIMLGTSEFNPAKANVTADNPGKAWTGVVIRLTKPCKAVANRTVVDCQPGDEIIVGGMDMADLYKAANHGTFAFEVLLTPDKILPLGGGRKMWLYEKLVNPKGIERKANQLFFFARPPVQQAPALPARSEADTVDSDIPF